MCPPGKADNTDQALPHGIRREAAFFEGNRAQERYRVGIAKDTGGRDRDALGGNQYHARLALDDLSIRHL